MKYEAIYTLSSTFSVRKMCKALELKERSYYQWIITKDKNKEKEENKRQLVSKIKEIFEDNKKIYGYRKMQQALEKENIILSIYSVRKLMRENGLYSIIQKKYRPYSRTKGNGRFFDNILNQDFKANRINQLWAGDITYIKTNLGFAYLAVVIDLYNKEIIGYHISKQINCELTNRALSNAISNANGQTRGIIFHSDRGSQYRSKSFQDMLNKYGIIGSMSKPGCPYDNACTESFYSLAKKECIYRKQYDTIEEVKQDMFAYIELFYNRKRMHSSLGYMSPVEYRLSFA